MLALSHIFSSQVFIIIFYGFKPFKNALRAFPSYFQKSWLRKRQASRKGELPTKDFFQKILQGPSLPSPSTLKALDSSMNHCQKAINNTPKLARNTVASLGQDWCVLHSDILRNQTYCLSLTTFSEK